MNQVPISEDITAMQDISGRWYLQDNQSKMASIQVWDSVAQAEEAYGFGNVEWDAESSDEVLVAKCIGCGCDDLHACEGDDGIPCHWERLDRTVGLGVCSECPEDIEAWDAGDREYKIPVSVES